MDVEVAASGFTRDMSDSFDEVHIWNMHVHQPRSEGRGGKGRWSPYKVTYEGVMLSFKVYMTDFFNLLDQISPMY